MKSQKKSRSPFPDVNIWIVEDNASFRRNLAKFLNDSPGISCSKTFSSCEAAIEALKMDFSPEVILLDIGLPGMSGVDGIKHMKSLAPACHVIIITVYDDSEHVFNAICAGASGYLLKTSLEGKILEAVDDALHGGSPMNAQIARKVLSMFAALKSPPFDYRLTIREKEILDLMMNSLTKRQISEKLFLSYHTVDTHIRSIYYKLQVHTRSGAVAKALKERLL